jgi:(6-4)DNA photolyase
MDGGRPLGGQWNFDADNRATFGQAGPGPIGVPRSFRPDQITRAVIGLVERRFAGAPGSLAPFDYPVTHEQAQLALLDFVQHRLVGFGRYQDAMATGQPYTEID